MHVMDTDSTVGWWIGGFVETASRGDDGWWTIQLFGGLIVSVPPIEHSFARDDAIGLMLRPNAGTTAWVWWYEINGGPMFRAPDDRPGHEELFESPRASR